jgi:hypothetical protein
MNASLVGASHVPFNNLIKMADIDMSRLKVEMRKLKKKELTLVSVGYGGLSINVLHFLSLLAYRVDIDNIFKMLHIYEEDKISYTNAMRIYKDLTRVTCKMGERLNKTEIFDEDNLAENIVLHQYYLTKDHIGDINDKVVFFGAPDFETRDMLKEYNFVFGGHNGDNLAFVYKPDVDSDMTAETYGTINIASFFLNMLKAAEQLVYILASDEKYEPDTILFEHNAKDSIKRRFKRVDFDYGKDVSQYEINEDMQLII